MFIGAILFTASYTILAPLTLFLGPTHPGTVTVPPNLTQYEISLLKMQYDDAMRTYHLYLLVQCALIQQVLDAIESKYLTRICNRLTGYVPNDIRALHFQLFQAYGVKTPKNSCERYEKLASMQYNIDEPINIIYTSVNNLREIAEMAGTPYTPEQLVDLGYMVIASQPVF